MMPVLKVGAVPTLFAIEQMAEKGFDAQWSKLGAALPSAEAASRAVLAHLQWILDLIGAAGGPLAWQAPEPDSYDQQNAEAPRTLAHDEEAAEVDAAVRNHGLQHLFRTARGHISYVERRARSHRERDQHPADPDEIVRETQTVCALVAKVYEAAPVFAQRRVDAALAEYISAQ